MGKVGIILKIIINGIMIVQMISSIGIFFKTLYYKYKHKKPEFNIIKVQPEKLFSEGELSAIKSAASDISVLNHKFFLENPHNSFLGSPNCSISDQKQFLFNENNSNFNIGEKVTIEYIS